MDAWAKIWMKMGIALCAFRLVDHSPRQSLLEGYWPTRHKLKLRTLRGLGGYYALVTRSRRVTSH